MIRYEIYSLYSSFSFPIYSYSYRHEQDARASEGKSLFNPFDIHYTFLNQFY
ncbi:hypothetical protein C8N27_2620 [Tenacibaculum discolor]|nr:hypothetical protein C8N27_2620 [Tenacibaculum discolor]